MWTGNGEQALVGREIESPGRRQSTLLVSEQPSVMWREISGVYIYLIIWQRAFDPLFGTGFKLSMLGGMGCEGQGEEGGMGCWCALIARHPTATSCSIPGARA
jgi:hypothetical protein